MRVKSFFDRRAKHYEKMFLLPAVKMFGIAEVRKILSVADVRAKAVLDIGCGYGKFSSFWKEKMASLVVGMDFSKKMLEQAPKNSDCSFILGDMFKIPVKDKSFDLVTCIGVANYYENAAPILKEIRRVSRQSAIITFPGNSLMGGLYKKISGIEIFLKEKDSVSMMCSKHFCSYSIEECAFGLTFVVSGLVKA